MSDRLKRPKRRLAALCLVALVAAVPGARASEVWLQPTYQSDLGGFGIGSNVTWPVTAIGAVRFAWAVPADAFFLDSAKLVVIPHAGVGTGTINVLVCGAKNGNMVGASCSGPFTQTFASVTNQLSEVDVAIAVRSKISTPGADYIAVLAYTTPATSTDHIVGLRLAYDPNLDLGTFSGKLYKGGLPILHNGAENINTKMTNMFVGFGSGNVGINTGQNTGVGANTLAGTTDGGANTALGADALQQNTSGAFNTAVGVSALKATHANSNTAVGYNALSTFGGNSFGPDGNNIALGDSAGSLLTSGTNNLYLDNRGAAIESQTIRIGDTQTRTFIQGIRGRTTGVADAIPVVIDSNGQVGTVSSSSRFKEDIHDMADSSRKLFDLRPVTFRYATPFC